jgi:hypothetical protein
MIRKPLQHFIQISNHDASRRVGVMMQAMTVARRIALAASIH